MLQSCLLFTQSLYYYSHLYPRGTNEVRRHDNEISKYNASRRSREVGVDEMIRTENEASRKIKILRLGDERRIR